MSSTEAPISITVKTPKGSLVTVRAETAAELDQIIALGLASIADGARELEAAVAGSYASPVDIAHAAQAVASQLGGSVVNHVSTSSGAGRNCPHGKMTGIQGQGRDGGLYKGYFCPSAQGAVDKCRTQYVKENSPEWSQFVPDKVK